MVDTPTGSPATDKNTHNISPMPEEQQWDAQNPMVDDREHEPRAAKANGLGLSALPDGSIPHITADDASSINYLSDTEDAIVSPPPGAQTIPVITAPADPDLPLSSRGNGRNAGYRDARMRAILSDLEAIVSNAVAASSFPQQPQQPQQQQHQGPPPSYSQAQLQEIQRVQQNTIFRRMIQTGIMPPNFTDHQKMIFKQLQEEHLQEQAAAAAAGGASGAGAGAGAKGASPLLPSANITGPPPTTTLTSSSASVSVHPTPKSQSNASLPISTSDQSSNAAVYTYRPTRLTPPDLPHTTIAVKGSRIILADYRGKEVMSFVISVTIGDIEPYSVEKLYSELLTLDARIKSLLSRSMVKKLGVLPDGKLFKDNASSMVDQRTVCLLGHLLDEHSVT
jgi:hypothetical protein